MIKKEDEMSLVFGFADAEKHGMCVHYATCMIIRLISVDEKRQYHIYCSGLYESRCT